MKKNYEELRNTFKNFMKDKYYLPLVVELSNQLYNIFKLRMIKRDLLHLEIYLFDRVPSLLYIPMTRENINPNEVIHVYDPIRENRMLLKDFSIQEQAFFHLQSLPFYCLFLNKKIKKVYSNVIYFDEDDYCLKFFKLNYPNLLDKYTSKPFSLNL